MTIPLMLLQYFGPALAGLLANLADRFMTGLGQSALKGGTVGAGLIGVMQMMGCDLELGKEAVIGLVGAAPLLFGVPADKVLPTLEQAMRERVKQAKKSKEVTAAANAEQDKWK